MRLIGLTGGISTGKTTVSNYLDKRYQLPIWDADIYAREAVSPGSLILGNIVERYGPDVLSEASLNRQKLGEIVFGNPTERQWLEKQIHPYVRDRFLQNTEKLAVESQSKQKSSKKPKAISSNPTAVLAIPLLFEAQMTDLVTEIWVVYASGAQQIQRLMKRDRLTEEQAIARINAQMPLEEKCQKADVVLDNSTTLETLLGQVDLAIAKTP